MAYDKKKLYKQAIDIATEKKCFFIEQLVSFMPCAKKTFYEIFPIGSDECNAIKDVLEANKVATKSKMYNKWFESDNPTLQVALMKLIATTEQAHRLNGSKTESKVDDKRDKSIEVTIVKPSNSNLEIKKSEG